MSQFIGVNFWGGVPSWLKGLGELHKPLVGSWVKPLCSVLFLSCNKMHSRTQKCMKRTVKIIY